MNKEIFEAYCEESGFVSEVWIESGETEILTDTISYKLFELNYHIKELKAKIINIIAEIRLRIKGVVK